MAKIYKIALIFLFFAMAPAAAEAAALYFSPSSGSYRVGSILSVSAYVGSADQAMNAASGVISFPEDKLEVASLSKSGSIFTLWVQEPSFSNSVGTINFEGIVLNPGFSGEAGKIITVNFRVKAAGAALLNFLSGSALANDGKGTNILASLGSARFSLGGAVSSPVSGVPPAPEIISPTHPDPDRWYAKKDAKFIWSLPKGVTAVRLLVGKIPAAIPTVVYSPAVSEKEAADFADGIWYFHAQFRNAGGWGEISHFRFQIDTQPPEPFKIKFIDGAKTENPNPIVTFDTTDSLSGVDYYKIKISEGDFFSVAPEIVKKNPYILPSQNPGERSILVQAFDKAGNYSDATEEFVIMARPAILQIGSLKISFWLAAVPLLALVILLAAFLWYGWHKFLLLRKRTRKEVREAESTLHRTFDLLKEDIRQGAKKPLKKDLDDAEKFVKKEIQDIEKEVV